MYKEDLCTKILELVVAYNRQMYEYGKSFRNYGTAKQLRVDQIRLIDLIGSDPGLNLRTLAEQTGNSIPTLSLQIDRLKKLELITKRRSETDQREIVIDLTEEGRRAYEYHQALDRDFIDRSTCCLMGQTEDQLETIAQFMRYMTDNQLRL